MLVFLFVQLDTLDSFYIIEFEIPGQRFRAVRRGAPEEIGAEATALVDAMCPRNPVAPFKPATPLSDERQAQFSSEASESIARQNAIEASDSISLDEYLATYFSSGS